MIAGAGLVGGSLAERLADAHHDVVVIDSDKAVCEQLAASVGALVLHGSATDIAVLEQAGIGKADVAVSTRPLCRMGSVITTSNAEMRSDVTINNRSSPAS